MRTDDRHCWSGHETLARLSILERVYGDVPVAKNSDDAAMTGLVSHKASKCFMPFLPSEGHSSQNYCHRPTAPYLSASQPSV